MPLVYKPIWKLSPTDANLLVQLERRPALLERFENSEIQLMILINIQDSATVQTQPVAIWDAESKTLLWNLKDINNDFLIAKIECPNVLPEKSLLRFILSGNLISKVEFQAPEILNITKMVQSGIFDSANQLIQ